jgi:predicted esterase
MDCFNTLRHTEECAHQWRKMILLHGEEDTVVPYWHTNMLHGICLSKGVSCKKLIVPGKDHQSILHSKELIDAFKVLNVYSLE